MSVTVLGVLHKVGLTDLTDAEVRLYLDLCAEGKVAPNFLSSPIDPLKPLRAVAKRISAAHARVFQAEAEAHARVFQAEGRASLNEADARAILNEAQARLLEAQARLIEAEVELLQAKARAERLAEAEA